MALSSKKQKTETTSQQQNTAQTTPDVPDWIKQPAMNLAGGINSLIGQGPTAFTPQTNELQRNTWNQGADLKGYGGTDFSGAQGAIGGIGDIQGESVLSGLENYYNPYKEQVLNPVLSDYDETAGITRAGQAAAAAQNKAFQGSRYGIQEAATEGQLARGRSAAEGGLLSDMFTQATGLSAGDAARRQAAATSNQGAAISRAGLEQSLAAQRSQEGLALSADEQARLRTQAGLGQQQFETEAGIKQYPLEYQKQMEGLLQGLNPALFTGQTNTGTSTGTGSSTTTANQSLGSWFGDFLTAGAQAAGKAAMAGA